MSGKKERKAAKLAGYFAWAIVILLVALSAYILICSINGKAASVFGVSIVKVVSGSMEPSIHEGDYIIIRKIKSSELKAGDIICFYSRDEEIYGMLNTHRIVRILDGGFITKGDANNIEDSAAVAADDIVGKYEGKSRFLGWLDSFSSGKKLLFAAIVIIMSATAVYEVITIAKVSAECKAKKAAEEEQAVREAIEREKQKLYEQNSEKQKDGEDD